MIDATICVCMMDFVMVIKEVRHVFTAIQVVIQNGTGDTDDLIYKRRLCGT
jgi:hypothetical protein